MTGEVQVGYQEKILHQEGSWAMEQASQGSGHGTKPAGVQYAVGQHSQTHSLFFGWFFEDPGVGLNDPCGSLPTQDVL